MANSLRRFLIAVLVGVSNFSVEPASAGVFGSPKFVITQPDDRFSSDGRTTWTSEGNRISKRSIAGGTHIDRTGVFLNPSVVVNTETGKVGLLALTLVNITERMGGIGAPNALGLPKRVSFITGEGQPIVLEITSAERTFGEVRCSEFQMGCTTPIVESGMAVISIEDYRRLISANALAIKVQGSERSHVYETKDIERSFIPNLKTFYTAHVAARE